MERIAAAVLYPPLRGLLSNLNNSESLFSTFGSKIWDSVEEGAEEPFVFASRIDLVFLREDANFGTGPHQTLAERLAELLEQRAGGGCARGASASTGGNGRAKRLLPADFAAGAR